MLYCIKVSVGRGSTRVYPYGMRKTLRTHANNKKDAKNQRTVNLNLYYDMTVIY